MPKPDTQQLLSSLRAMLDQTALRAEQREAIRQRIDRVLNYQATVGVLGKTGAGKSSLCNALFGRDVASVSDVEACTRQPQTIHLTDHADKGLSLLDMPGVGESEQRDSEYQRLYQQWLPTLDLVLWVIKADDRALTIDQRFYRQIVQPLVNRYRLPVLIVISQSDKIEPCREWQAAQRQPGPVQQQNLIRKQQQLATLFGLSPHHVVAVSAETGYGLVTLVEQTIQALPKEKKWGLLRETHVEHVSERACRESANGLWDTIVEGVKEVVQAGWEAVTRGLGSAISRLFSWW